MLLDEFKNLKILTDQERKAGCKFAISQKAQDMQLKNIEENKTDKVFFLEIVSVKNEKIPEINLKIIQDNLIWV